MSSSSHGLFAPDPPRPRGQWRMPRWWLFPIWLAVFYACWLGVVFLGGQVDALLSHGPIAVAMALGSYVAGATPMGGGTIGFPVLVLLFDEPADIGRQFSFAVQSIGMTSAGIFIVATRRPVAWRMLGWSCLGAAVATPLGVSFVAPIVDDSFIKLLFAVLWASFGVMHLAKVRELVGLQGMSQTTRAFERNMGLLVGLLGGGLLASTTGVGIDMLAYTILVLVWRCDLRTAVPTSIILMAFTSLIGIGSSVLLDRFGPAHHAMSPEVFGNWIAAAPVVALGAPFGAFMVHLIPRGYTLVFVSILCLGQFVWTCLHEGLGPLGFAIAFGFVLLSNGLFVLLHRWGLQRAAVRAERAPQTASEVAPAFARLGSSGQQPQ